VHLDEESERERQNMSEKDTPNVEAGQALFQDKLNEIYARILQRNPVAGASQKADAAKSRVEQLKESKKRLVARATEISTEILKLNDLCQSSLIEQYAGSKDQPDVSQHLRSLPALECEHKIVTQATAQIAEHLQPKAEIDEIRAVADYSAAQAEALRDVASERLKKTNELIAGAAEHEGEITYDPTRTVSGVLQSQAGQLDTMARNQRRIADEREQDYLRIQREKGKLS